MISSPLQAERSVRPLAVLAALGGVLAFGALIFGVYAYLNRPSAWVPQPHPGYTLLTPAKVTAGATFEVDLLTGTPPRKVISERNASILRHGKVIWWLTWGGPIRPRPRQVSTADIRETYGPWTYEAPPKAGHYDVCKAIGLVRWPGPGPGLVCNPIEVTAAP